MLTNIKTILSSVQSQLSLQGLNAFQDGNIIKIQNADNVVCFEISSSEVLTVMIDNVNKENVLKAFKSNGICLI